MADRSFTPATTKARPRKLKRGDKIRMVGTPLPGLDPTREYRVAYVSYIQGVPVYAFRLNRGRLIVVKHYAKHVDPWIGRKKNRIEII